MKLENIGFNELEETTGGFSNTEIYIVKLKDLFTVTEPIKRESETSNVKNLTYIHLNHTLKEGVTFTKVTAIKESIKLETKQIGKPNESVVQENTLTLKLLGSKPAILGFKRWLKGEDLIVLAKEFGSDYLRQFGSKKMPCKLVEAKSVIEATIEGSNTTELKFTDKQLYDAPYYLGDLSGVAKPFTTDYNTITSDREDITCDRD